MSGIGVVNAMEVVLAFPGLEGLKAFRDWVETPDATLVGLAAQRFGGNPGTQELEEGETGAWPCVYFDMSVWAKEGCMHLSVRGIGCTEVWGQSRHPGAGRGRDRCVGLACV